MQSKQLQKNTSASADGTEGDYVPLPLLGKIKEKGFSDASYQQQYHIPAPKPRVTPFPVARHRSEGPHWAPSPRVENTDSAKEYLEERECEHFATRAQPVLKKKKKSIDFSKWKTGKGSDSSLNIVSDSRCKQEDLLELALLDGCKQEDQSEKPAIRSNSIIKHTPSSSSLENGSNTSVTSQLSVSSMSSRSSGIMQDMTSTEEFTLENMTNEQIAEAQRELSERFRPDILDMLRRRGKEKAEKTINTESNLDASVAETLDLKMKINDESVRQHEQKESLGTAGLGAPSSALNISKPVAESSLASQFTWEGKNWAERVEAVRTYRFGLDGNCIGIDPNSATSISETKDKDSQWKIPNVTERDFLRMEGAPSLHGYTIKEAVTLARSMVPAQRAAALRLIDNILNKAMSWLHAGVWDDNSDMLSTDWQAVHAYALGPEPELALTLRIALDDSHATAVVTCARALESLLSSSVNENFFSLCESLLPNEYCAFTAPVFKKPFFKETGLMEDCYWKLNVKPTDMFPYSKKDQSQEENSEATVKDDTYISNQDIASGLIRMGILPRIRYLLEVERLTAAEDSLFNILIALSRHSQAAANAVMNCPRLMGTIHELFVLDETLTWSVRQKAVKLLKVLSIAKMSNCIEICNMGLFEKSLRSLLHQSLTVATPNQICQTGSWAELAEALSFWRVCIKYGLCISCFSDYYPALLFWIAAPDSHTVLKSFNVRDATLAEGSFHLLEALACTLPILHGAKDMEQSNFESSSDSWSWKSAIPVIETSLEWLSAELVQHLMQKLVQLDEEDQFAKVASKLLLRVMSSVLHFLSTACERIIAKGNSGPSWLPVFVPKVCMRLIRSGILNFNKADKSEFSILSFTNCLLKLKHKASEEHLLGIINCIYGLVRLLEILDFLVDSGDNQDFGACELNDVSYTEQIMQCGIVLSAKDGLLQALKDTSDDLMHKSLVSGTVKASRRGGPAPGVGMGWGCKGGGHWSNHALLTQAELVLVQRLTDLLSSKGILSEDGVEANSISSDPRVPWRLRAGLSILNLAGPYHKDLVETIFRESIFRTSSVDFYIREANSLVKQWSLKFEEKTSQKIEYDLSNLYKLVPDIRESLLRHIKMMWLAQKAKCKKEEIVELGENPRIEHRSYKKFSTLPTVPEEDPGISQISGIKQLAVQWAGQKLPIPQFWLLSPLLRNLGQNALGDGYVTQNIVRYGLLLLSGMEAVKVSFPLNAPIAMKIHSLSNIFVMSDDIFLEKDVNHMIGALQEKLIYDIYLDADGNDERNSNDWKNQSSSMLDRGANEISLLNLDFQSLVDERYSSFLDKLTSQFSSVSYGDLVFGRQITIYLTMDVPVYLRLRVWKSLESEHMLHFLPPLNKCPGPSKIYLYPLLESQESQDLMKAYASSLTSGALDRARARGSVSFSIAIFSVASFIFSRSRDHDADSSKTMFAKDFMLQLAQSSQFQEMLLELVRVNQIADQDPTTPYRKKEKFILSVNEVEKRFGVLKELCSSYAHIVERIQHLENLKMEGFLYG